jgi:hypothetical protein
VTDVPVAEGHVVKLVTDDELLFNRGSRDGVKKDMYFNVLDPNTQNVSDPITGEDLGSVDRIKAQIRITSVSERMSLGRVYPPRGRGGLTTSVELLMGPKPLSGKLTGDTWPDGVDIGDPVRYVTG